MTSFETVLDKSVRFFLLIQGHGKVPYIGIGNPLKENPFE